MAKNAAPGLSNNAEIDWRTERSAMLNKPIQRGQYVGFDYLPKGLRKIVADYVSDNERDSKKCFVLGELPIIIGFSQRLLLEPGLRWYFGCLSSDERCDATRNVSIDKKYLIKDYQRCLDFLHHANSPYCRVFMKVFVFQLDASRWDLSKVLDDLQNAVAALQEHLDNVQQVVFVIDNTSFCCFSFKDVIDHATKQSKKVNRLLALKQILDDIRRCWKPDYSLGVIKLLCFYIFSNDKPISEIYLSKFVVSLDEIGDASLLRAINTNRSNSKLMPVYVLNKRDSVLQVHNERIGRCHTLYLDSSSFGAYGLFERLRPDCCFEDKPSMERIVIGSVDYNNHMTLPRPSTPLHDSTTRSALIELTLTCSASNNLFDLGNLSNDYFPSLVHLSINNGKLKGHLDSYRVPSLKTLRINLPTSPSGEFQTRFADSMYARTLSLLDAGRPWQLVATTSNDSWSLASYDEPTAHPHDDAKEDSYHSRAYSLPLIRELLLVANTQESIDDWQSQLKGEQSLDANVVDREYVLTNALQRVQSITAFGTYRHGLTLNFTHSWLAILPNLTSLSVHNMNVELDSNVLPRLQSLDVNYKEMQIAGAFSHLNLLSLKNVHCQTPWTIEAPFLQSLVCFGKSGENIVMRPQLLPHLSCVRIEPDDDDFACPVEIFDEKVVLGLSNVKHVMLGKMRMEPTVFDYFRLHDVSHLELTLAIAKLHECWSALIWRCEMLKINLIAIKDWKPHVSGVLPDIVLPDIVLPNIVLPALPLVRKLTVTEVECQVLLDREMPKLNDCTLPSPRLFGENLKCPALKRICFTDELSENEKQTCLDPTTYIQIGARPSEIRFGFDCLVHTIPWDIAPDEN